MAKLRDGVSLHKKSEALVFWPPTPVCQALQIIFALDRDLYHIARVQDT